MSSPGERPGPGERLEHWRLPERAEDEAWVTGVGDATTRWGAAFIAYLLLPDTDPREPRTEREFIDCYAGWYPDRMSLCRAQLESLGWTDALSGFRTRLGLPPHAIDFDLKRIWAHCEEVYEMSERVGGVHAFLR